jgi:hypothetical protein
MMPSRKSAIVPVAPDSLLWINEDRHTINTSNRDVDLGRLKARHVQLQRYRDKGNRSKPDQGSPHCSPSADPAPSNDLTISKGSARQNRRRTSSRSPTHSPAVQARDSQQTTSNPRFSQNENSNNFQSTQQFFGFEILAHGTSTNFETLDQQYLDYTQGTELEGYDLEAIIDTHFTLGDLDFEELDLLWGSMPLWPTASGSIL